MNLCLRNRIRANIFGPVLRYSTSVQESDITTELVSEDPDEVLAREAEIEKKRNVSRLSSAHFEVINGRRPYGIPKATEHLTVKYNRKMYGKYGLASGVNPSICWPTKDEIQEVKEYESVAFPYTIPQMIEMAAEKRRNEHMKIMKREEDVATKFAKLDQWKKELQAKIDKKTKEVKAAKVKKERLVEEVRLHFGFKLDPRDDRFKEMLAKKEKEYKKQEKLAKQKEKEKAMIAKLQQSNAEISETK